MTDPQEDHLLDVKRKFDKLCDQKYRRGQAEHGGDLFEKSKRELVDMALDEAIDQVVYLITLRDRLYM